MAHRDPQERTHLTAVGARVMLLGGWWGAKPTDGAEAYKPPDPAERVPGTLREAGHGKEVDLGILLVPRRAWRTKSPSLGMLPRCRMKPSSCCAGPVG